MTWETVWDCIERTSVNSSMLGKFRQCGLRSNCFKIPETVLCSLIEMRQRCEIYTEYIHIYPRITCSPSLLSLTYHLWDEIAMNCGKATVLARRVLLCSLSIRRWLSWRWIPLGQKIIGSAKNQSWFNQHVLVTNMLSTLIMLEWNRMDLMVNSLAKKPMPFPCLEMSW